MQFQVYRGALTGVGSFALSLVFFSGVAMAAVEIDQQPLLVAKPVPGNMAIVGSFEFPTMVSKANNGAQDKPIDASYNTSTQYVGYFDSRKCYRYVYHASEADRHFEPVDWNGDDCGGDYWSGRFLNWATMQSIDVFRSVMTGGYRAKDSVGETWLEKGWDTGQGSDNNFPDSRISGDPALIRKLTPTPFSTITASVRRLGNKMYFINGTSWSKTVIDYQPDTHKGYSYHGGDINKGGWGGGNNQYVLSVRVKVCVPDLEEENCKAYGSNSKPEGLIQQYSDSMRFSHFSYLGDGAGDYNEFDGVAMRSRMKYVGVERLTSDNVWETNPNREWYGDTGVFLPIPDSDVVDTALGVQRSGVINTINNAGMLASDPKYKKYDTVSELYYLAYRYFKGLPPPTGYYGAISGASSSLKSTLADGLPVVTEWYPSDTVFSDPIQFSCQKNFVLGIGDTNTHYDRTLPGGTGTDVGTKPSDDNVNVQTELTRIVNLEKKENAGFSLHTALTGSHRSAYIASLAYNGNARDLRPDADGMPGKQTMSTYWIDIQEYGNLKGRRANQYWLAAKYGGLKLPESFDPATWNQALPEAWWHTNAQTLTPNELDKAVMKRPDNFYTVNKAAELVTSLKRAFSDMGREQRGNRSSLALNSTVLEAGAATFQAEYTSGSWTGNLNAFSIDANTGEIGLTPAWDAASKLPAWDSRNIQVGTGTGANKGMTAFTSDNKSVTTALKKLLTDAAGVNTNQANDLIEYLRGKRDGENSLNGFRMRQGVLGDIINSQPVYVGAPGANVFRNRSFQGSNSYATFVTQKSGRTPVVYVGGNDGMLHGFNATVGQADSGKEIFAYIPHTVVKNGLGELARRDYEHRYFVDGELTVADAYDGTNWRTVLVGTLGAGGLDEDRETSNAVFALDVTDPSNISLLWEVSSAELPGLGINLGKPVIAQVANGVWKVLLGNGPNSNDGTASLISIDVFSGSASAFAVSAGADNGLSAVRAWDSDSDGFTDTAYAGDLKGKLWKITGLGGTPSATILFTTAEGQPITAMPLMGRSPYSRQLWLFFGTGQYLNTGDLSDTTIQSWYGIKEAVSGATRDDLLERKILADVDVGNGITARVIEEGTREDLNEKAGWYIDLAVGSEALGERMVTANQFQGSALIGNTRIPDASDPCAPTGRGVIMAIDPFTGARLHDSYFDLDGDRQFTSTDMVMVNGELVPASGIGLDTGFSNPSFLGDKMFIPTDDGRIRERDINRFSTGVGRTSWRELINTGR